MSLRWGAFIQVDRFRSVRGWDKKAIYSLRCASLRPSAEWYSFGLVGGGAKGFGIGVGMTVPVPGMEKAKAQTHRAGCP
ncbi:MAG: hypothetical protein ACRYFU_13025 [Janthinobacterium lividum]